METIETFRVLNEAGEHCYLSMVEIADMVNALDAGERILFGGLPEEVYHALPGIGSTALKAATISPAHYKVQVEGERVYTKATEKAFDIGSAVHCLVLEPLLFDSKFVVQSADIKRRQGKAWDTFKEANKDKVILTKKDKDQASAMASSLLDNCGKYFVGGEAERSYWYKHENGLLLKARIDYQIGDAAIDLKTTKSKTPVHFLRSVRYDYDMQDASYQLVSGLNDMIYVGISKEEPFQPFLAKHTSNTRAESVKIMDDAFNKIIFAKEFNDYPVAPVELMTTDEA